MRASRARVVRWSRPWRDRSASWCRPCWPPRRVARARLHAACRCASACWAPLPVVQQDRGGASIRVAEKSCATSRGSPRRAAGPLSPRVRGVMTAATHLAPQLLHQRWRWGAGPSRKRPLARTEQHPGERRRSCAIALGPAVGPAVGGPMWLRAQGGEGAGQALSMRPCACAGDPGARLQDFGRAALELVP